MGLSNLQVDHQQLYQQDQVLSHQDGQWAERDQMPDPETYGPYYSKLISKAVTSITVNKSDQLKVRE